MNSVAPYEQCPWYVKLWRWRFMLLVPYATIAIWLALRQSAAFMQSGSPPTLRESWHMAVTLAWFDMVRYSKVHGWRGVLPTESTNAHHVDDDSGS